MAVIHGRRVAMCVALFLTIAWPARAHRQATGQAVPDDAIAIANLTHGQMTVIADNMAAILDAADRQQPTDRVMRRLQGFINIQRSVCLWGLAPGSLTDEDSPFNECAHAYLAAARALLLHLRDMPGDRRAALDLTRKIEFEMIEHGAALVLCRYSDEPFNTADVIFPDWSRVLLRLIAPLALVTIGGARAAVQWKPADQQDGDDSSATLVQGLSPGNVSEGRSSARTMPVSSNRRVSGRHGTDQA